MGKRKEVKPIYGEVNMVLYLPFSENINSEIMNVIYKNSLIYNFDCYPLDTSSVAVWFVYSSCEPRTLTDHMMSFNSSAIRLVSDHISFVLQKNNIVVSHPIIAHSFITIDTNREKNGRLMLDLFRDYLKGTNTVEEVRVNSFTVSIMTTFNLESMKIEGFYTTVPSYYAIRDYIFERCKYVRTCRN
jgi:hypothetical protein